MSKADASLPDFDLAPFVEIDPRALLGNPPTPYERMFLTLALVYNDLKDTAWFSYQLSKAENVIPVERIPARGQINGMRLHLIRLWVGLLHELFDLLREERDRALADPAFKGIIARLHPRDQERWRALESVACDATPDRKAGPSSVFRNQLRRIRNFVSFHYGKTHKLAEGYEHFFFRGSGKAEYAEKALLSDGATAESTRFYFADAAAQGAIYQETGTTDSEWFDLVSRTVVDLNAVLKPLVCFYIEDCAFPREDAT